MRTLISNATLVNEGKTANGSLIIEDDRIADVLVGNIAPCGTIDKEVDATGCSLLPGVIDDHVHFREPGLTAKADIASESRAAAYGGVTTYFDMPNTVPQTTTLEALADKRARAAKDSRVNYAFFFGATNDNHGLFAKLDRTRIPGIKLFMGSSTGNMLVDREETLNTIFSTAGMPIMAHCEDTDIINNNVARAKEMYGDDPEVAHHAEIRSREACLKSTQMAVALARKHHARLHVAHVTTADELALFDPCPDHGTLPMITAEAVIAHLFFSDTDYMKLGTRIKCNPSVKSLADREALRRALTDGTVSVVGTDHAPHLLSDKQGGCLKAASGMPMVQFSLVAMLQLVSEGVLTIERVVQLMCHNPARLFGVSERGYLRRGFKADLVVVRPNVPFTVTDDCIQSKCGWSPMLGRQFSWQVEHTFCNGNHLLNRGVFNDQCRGEEVRFDD